MFMKSRCFCCISLAHMFVSTGHVRNILNTWINLIMSLNNRCRGWKHASEKRLVLYTGSVLIRMSCMCDTPGPVDFAVRLRPVNFMLSLFSTQVVLSENFEEIQI